MFITVRLHEKKQVVILSTLMSKEDPVFNGMSPMPVILVFIYSVDIMYILLIGKGPVYEVVSYFFRRERNPVNV